MDDEFSQINRRTCCRLCLAPDNECVPIFTTSAADKEPLSSKIQACVTIKVHEADRLSSRICHSCISYLNSWQSFKNRCLNSQKKQRTWLMLMTEKDKEQQQQQHQQPQQQQQTNNAARRKLQQINKNIISYENSTGKRRRSYSGGDQQINASFNDAQPIEGFELGTIKKEPIDAETDVEDEPTAMSDDPVSLKMELDPTQFLARNEEDDEEYPIDDDDQIMPPIPIMSMEEGPPILTSLGLTHINHVNPYNFLATEHEFPDESQNDDKNSSLYNMQVNQKRRLTPVPACCSICDMKFSNRANARRHERNIHGVILNPMSVALVPQNPITSTPNPKPAVHKKIVQLPEVIDYDNPQKYRSLLTEQKLAFMVKNMAFMEQYQDMTCVCCDRQFLKYKTFMSHMRKKFQYLPRNLCFKCLKQFETKGQFIAHLKKKNCINLYKIYMADDTIIKQEVTAMTPEDSTRVGTKEIIANRVYGCKLCTQTFRLKMDFRAHVYGAHADEQKSKDVTGAACAFCNAEFDEPVLRRRHYNNLDCIIFLICGNCDEKFETHAQYIEHVYTAHLTNMSIVKTLNETLDASDEFDATNNISPSTSLRTPQNCAVCGKQYNNYYNVLRHMESKHPDQLPSTYQCETCQAGFPRQSELREHIKKQHPEVLIRTPIKGTFICNDCGALLDNKEQWIEHMLTHSKFVCHECDYKTENKNEFDIHLIKHLKFKLYSCTLCKHSYNTEKGLELHMIGAHNLDHSSAAAAVKTAAAPLSFAATIAAAAASVVAASSSSSISEGGQNGNADATKLSRDIKAELLLLTENKNSGKEKELQASKLEDISHLIPTLERITKTKKDNGDFSRENNSEEPILPKQRECPICKAVFNAGVAFSNHMRTHMISNTAGSGGQSKTSTSGGGISSSTNSTRLRCRVCHKRINTNLGLKRHMLLAHQIRNSTFVKCYICSAEFSNHKGLRVHLFRAHQITKIEDEQQPVISAVLPVDPVITSVQSIHVNTDMKHFECDVCHTVYRNFQDLKVHNKTVHGFDINDENNESQINPNPIQQIIADNELLINLPQKLQTTNEIWFQCRYCNDTFNSSKKLTIHMNTHDEHDQSDYSCKDCGNVYATRKSLWVHRYKKHPRPPNPIICEICKKTFFDKTELYYHLKTHSQQLQQTENLSYVQQQQLQLQQQRQLKDELERQQLEDGNDNENDDNIIEQQQQQQQQKSKRQKSATVGIYSCHVCGQTFHDKGVLSKHLRIHEMQNNMFSNSPLLTSFDQSITGVGAGAGGGGAGVSGIDYKLSYQDNMVNGEYACDLCPKTFPILNALHVHRGWHFRSPSGRQVTEPGNTWQPDSIPPSKLRRMKNPYGSPPVCPYCISTFASTNNLRRHIVEVHKRNEAKLMREKGSGDGQNNVFIEKVKECKTCNITFNTCTEWIDHKIIHARNQKPSTTFEWACEICGKMFTRKERLLQHMITHLSSREFDDDGVRLIMNTNNDSNSVDQSQLGSDMNFESNSQTSQSSMSSSNNHHQNNLNNDDDDNNMDDDDDNNVDDDDNNVDDDDEDDDNDNDNDNDDNGENVKIDLSRIKQLVENDDDEEDDDDEDEDEDENDDNDDDDDDEENDYYNNDENISEHSNQNKNDTFACELCHTNFNTTKELRRHVAHHILNGAGQGAETSSPTSPSRTQSTTTTTTTKGTNNFKDTITKNRKNSRNSTSSPTTTTINIF